VSVDVTDFIWVFIKRNAHGYLLEDRGVEFSHDDDLLPGDVVDLESFAENALGLAV